jgi:hypothetical protein
MRFFYLSIASIILILFGVFPAIAGTVNLSLNPSTIALADDVYDGTDLYGAFRAIDGDQGSLWSASGFGSASNSHWLIVDLGSAFNITTITLKGPYTGTYPPNYNNDYILYTSINGADWQVLGAGSLFDSAEGYINTIDTAGLVARYAKYEVVGGLHWAHLNEFQIWGEQTSPVPEPSELLLLCIGMLSVIGYGWRHGKRE